MNNNQIRAVLLDRLPFRVARHFHGHAFMQELIRGGSWEVYHAEEARGFAVQLDFLVTGKVLENTVDVVVARVPRTWWEHCKRDFLPEWVRNRWPVRERAIRYSYTYAENRVCPHINATGTGSHVEFVLNDGPREFTP